MGNNPVNFVDPTGHCREGALQDQEGECGATNYDGSGGPSPSGLTQLATGYWTQEQFELYAKAYSNVNQSGLGSCSESPECSAAVLGALLWGMGMAYATTPSAVPPSLQVPQGVTTEQFSQISAIVRNASTQYGTDIAVHGSRAAGTARAASDLDIAIRVSAEEFNAIASRVFAGANQGSAAERTMLHAMEVGKIQRGELGLSALGRTLERMLGFKVDISVIQIGGPFDRGPFIPLK